MKWTNMETPPKEDGLYIVNQQLRYLNAPWSNKSIIARWSNGSWHCDDSSSYGLCDYVTHWMRLPSVPVEALQYEAENSQRLRDEDIAHHTALLEMIRKDSEALQAALSVNTDKVN